MSIELTPATPAEIAEFKLAAARRFKERGIDPKQASAAFDAYMAKLASQFGIRPQPSDKVQKTASWLSDKIKARKAESEAAAKSFKSVGKAVVEDVKGTKTYKAISEATKKKPVSKTAMLLADAMKDAACKAKAKGKKKPMPKKAQSDEEEKKEKPGIGKRVGQAAMATGGAVAGALGGNLLARHATNPAPNMPVRSILHQNSGKIQAVATAIGAMLGAGAGAKLAEKK